MAKSSRSNQTPANGGVSVVAGSIRTVDDPSALDVKISIWDTEITMRADGSELGRWPIDAVHIRPLDGFSFEFMAEGDRLIFLPNNPDVFREHPVVEGGATTGKRRRKARKEKKPVPKPVELRWDESSKVEEERRVKRTKSAPVVSIPKPEKAKRIKVPGVSASATPRTEAVVEAPHTRAEIEAPIAQATQSTAEARPAHQEWVDPFGPVETPFGHTEEPTKKGRRRPAKVAKPTVGKTPDAPHRGGIVDTLREKRHGAWIAGLDLARRYDWFGLDRVPVNEDQRNQPDHDHTWNHRVAPTSGPGKFICTICGAFRGDE